MEAVARLDVAKDDAGSWTPEMEQLLDDWYRRMCACQHAYYAEAERLRGWHYRLGVPSIILSSVVGTTVFASLQSGEVGINARIVIAVFSIGAAVLAGLQTFLGLAEAASSNAAAADWYSAIKRDLEQLRVMRRQDRGRAKDCIDALRKEINKAGQKSPELRETLWLTAAERHGVNLPSAGNAAPRSRLATAE